MVVVNSNDNRRSRVVVITGATAGVGRASARAFAERGDDVALIARGRQALDVAAKEVEAAGRRAITVEADVADASSVEAAAATVEEALGPIDVWVNNAMATVFSRFADMTAEEFRRVTDVTYHGYVHGTQAALRRMAPRGGTIVQVGSALAYRGIPLQSAYCGAKHAIEGFTESLRSELLHDGVDVHLCMVQLPGLNTPQFRIQRNKLGRKAQPVPPLYQPEVAARAIVYASEHRRREIWVGGRNAVAIMANRLTPGVFDRYLALTGVESQQSQEPEDPDRPDALFSSVPGDQGAHGDFDAVAEPRSRQLDLTLSPAWAFVTERSALVRDRALSRLLARLTG